MAACFEEAPDTGDQHEPRSKTGLPPTKQHSESLFIDVTDVDEGRGFVFFVNPPSRSTPHTLVPSSPRDQSAAVADSSSPDAHVIQQALRLLESRMRAVGPLLTNPQTVRDYLRLRIADLEHEVFVVLFLDAQHRLIVAEEMFRGTLSQTSVYPREIVKTALAHNAAA